MLIILAFNIFCLIALYAATSYIELNRDGVGAALLIDLAISSQMWHLLMLSGLWGRSTMAGLAVGSVLSIASLYFFGPGVMDTWEGNRDLMGIPLYLALAVVPILLARRFWGWQLVMHPAAQIPYRRWSLEDYFLLTASLATFGVLMSVADDGFQKTVWLPLFWIVFLMFCVGSTLIMYGAYAYFRCQLKDSTVFFLLMAFSLPHHLLLSMTSGAEFPWVALFGIPLCGLSWFIILAVYKIAGMRMVAYADRNERPIDQLSPEDRLFLLQSRRSARMATAGFFILAMVLNAITIYLQRNPQV